MNFESKIFKTPSKTSNFSENVLIPFLNKSKSEYPNSIVESSSDAVNITLFKEFPKNKYNFKYEKAIQLIGDFLKELISKYGLSEISFNEKSTLGFNPSFMIKVPLNINSKELVKYSDEIFKKVGDYAELNNIEFILDDLSIILSR